MRRSAMREIGLAVSRSGYKLRGGPLFACSLGDFVPNGALIFRTLPQESHTPRVLFIVAVFFPPNFADIYVLLNTDKPLKYTYVCMYVLVLSLANLEPAP